MSKLTPSQKTAYSTPTVYILIVIAGWLLSFVDMLLLSTALEKLLETDQLMASIFAFFFAAVGTTTAILWGRTEALHKKQSILARPEFWIWLLIGIMFIIIRIVVIMIDIKEYPEDAFFIMSSEALMAAILTILYTGTGLVVRTEARKIFDPDLFKEWRSLRIAKNIHTSIASRYSETERMIIELEDFSKNYLSLDKQYVIRKNSLVDAERTTLSSVVKRVLEDNPHLSPQVVDEILKGILAERSNR